MGTDRGPAHAGARHADPGSARDLDELLADALVGQEDEEEAEEALDRLISIEPAPASSWLVPEPVGDGTRHRYVPIVAIGLLAGPDGHREPVGIGRTGHFGMDELARAEELVQADPDCGCPHDPRCSHAGSRR